MRSIPYGYRIENGQAVIDETEAQVVQQVFQMYLSGKSLRSISREIGINRQHCGISKLLEDQKYLGTSFYPAIIEKALFEEVQKARQKSRERYAKSPQASDEAKVSTSFKMAPVTQQMQDPFEQAQYVFSLIKAKE